MVAFVDSIRDYYGRTRECLQQIRQTNFVQSATTHANNARTSFSRNWGDPEQRCDWALLKVATIACTARYYLGAACFINASTGSWEVLRTLPNVARNKKLGLSSSTQERVNESAAQYFLRAGKALVAYQLIGYAKEVLPFYAQAGIVIGAAYAPASVLEVGLRHFDNVWRNREVEILPRQNLDTLSVFQYGKALLTGAYPLSSFFNVRREEESSNELGATTPQSAYQTPDSRPSSAKGKIPVTVSRHGSASNLSLRRRRVESHSGDNNSEVESTTAQSQGSWMAIDPSIAEDLGRVGQGKYGQGGANLHQG